MFAFFGSTVFQSTLPLRGATAPAPGPPGPSANFNPRSPYGERPQWLHLLQSKGGFQSTLPLRGATRAGRPPGIHMAHFNPRSPYGERPSSRISCSVPRLDFNPRSPYGERLSLWAILRLVLIFQSTLPLRGATAAAAVILQLGRISIHAPLTGSDLTPSPRPSRGRNFNPRSPYGERPPRPC